MSTILRNQASDPLPINGQSRNHDDVKPGSVPGRAKGHARISKSLEYPMITSTDSSPGDSTMKKFMKNSRRSRSRFGRGLAKKGIFITKEKKLHLDHNRK